MNTLYLVIPCYNEEEVLDKTASMLKSKLDALKKHNKIHSSSKILFVNDGSVDKTWDIIKKLHEEDPIFCGINLSRNRGHQNALLSGLMFVKEKADMVISLDADLQDDIEVIERFVDEYHKGFEIVYGVRSSRKKDSFFKRNSAQFFYKLLHLFGVETIYNHADYRLMSKRALDYLSSFPETNLFLRGIIPLLGLKYSVVEYVRHERFAGESKYPLKKMLNFAWDGITSFSVKPIRFIASLGFIIFIVSLFVMLYTFVVKLFGYTEVGWTSLSVSIWMIGGIQLLSLGVIGEYIGKIYGETKRRPRYFISETLVS